MNLACKNALLEPRRRAPDLPRRGADAAGARRRRSRRARRAGSRRSTIAPPRGVDRATRCGCSRGAKRPVIIVGHGARFHMPRGDRARRAARRAGDHDVQGQGPDRRRPPARRRRARPQRHAGRELGHERGRPAARARRVVLQPHRHLPRPPDHPGRLRPDAARQVPPGRRCPVWGEIGVVVERLRAALAGARSRPTTRRRSSPSAGRSGARRRPAAPRDDRGHGVNSASVFAAMERHDPRRRGDRRRRRQPRLLVRPLLRVQAAHGADVRLPRLDRLRLPGRDGRVGGGAGAADRRRHRRRRLRASTWPSSRPRSSTA